MRLHITALLLSFLLMGVAEAKDVVIKYDNFLKMVSMKEHSDKTANQKAAENAVLVKLKDEQGSIIKVQAEQIRNCEGIVRTQEQLGATQEEIERALDDHLRDLTKEIAREKRLSRYKSEAVYLGIAAAVFMMVLN